MGAGAGVEGAEPVIAGDVAPPLGIAMKVFPASGDVGTGAALEAAAGVDEAGFTTIGDEAGATLEDAAEVLAAAAVEVRTPASPFEPGVTT